MSILRSCHGCFSPSFSGGWEGCSTGINFRLSTRQNECHQVRKYRFLISRRSVRTKKSVTAWDERNPTFSRQPPHQVRCCRKFSRRTFVAPRTLSLKKVYRAGTILAISAGEPHAFTLILQYAGGYSRCDGQAAQAVRSIREDHKKFFPGDRCEIYCTVLVFRHHQQAQAAFNQVTGNLKKIKSCA
jgi:hypothetical protein